MRPTDRSQSIAFLLSLGAIPVACTAGEDGPSTGLTAVATSIGSGTMTDPSGDTNDSEGTDSDGTPGTTGTTVGTDPSDTNPATTAEMTTTMSTTDASTDPSLTDPSTTDPDTGYGTYGSGGFQCSYQVPPVCYGYAAKIVECYPQYAQSEAMIGTDCGCQIEYYTGAYGPACAGAVEDYYACIASTSCQELAGGNACAGASMNVVDTCGFDEPGG